VSNVALNVDPGVVMPEIVLVLRLVMSALRAAVVPFAPTPMYVPPAFTNACTGGTPEPIGIAVPPGDSSAVKAGWSPFISAPFAIIVVVTGVIDDTGRPSFWVSVNSATQ